MLRQHHQIHIYLVKTRRLHNQYQNIVYIYVVYANAVSLPDIYESGDVVEAFMNGVIRLNALRVDTTRKTIGFNFDDINDTCYLNKDQLIKLYPGYLQFVDVIIYKIELF